MLRLWQNRLPAAVLQGTWLLTARFLRQTTEEAMADSDPTKPGDEATPGAPGTGENLCRHCAGTGKIGGEACPDCKGTGKVITGIGGG
jgi:hypothetical protein